MSLLNTDLIWLALGDFYDIFPEEERVYWNTFWDAYADLTADLWGHAFQTDRAKSLFDTEPTIERREVSVLLSNLTQDVFANFQIGGLKQDAGGRWILRGFVTRDQRDFSDQSLDDRGTIRIGTDIIDYLSVNTTSTTDGFVREATFVLDGDLPHDYQDDPDFNDDFTDQPLAMVLRIDHASGDTIIDATGDDVDVNPSGSLTLGSETLEYESVTITGNRCLFQLATTYQPPQTEAEKLTYPQTAGTELTVHRRDTSRWTQSLIGAARAVANGGVQLIIDPTTTTDQAALIGQYQLQDNVDFDVAVSVDPSTWPDPDVAGSKFALARINIGSRAHTIGIEARRVGSVTTQYAVTDTTELELTEAAPFEARFKRVGGVLESQFRPLTDDDYTLLKKEVVGGNRATLDLVLDDQDTESHSRVVYDEVLRRTGSLAGQERLEESFVATTMFPHTYDIDQRLMSVSELRDRPRVRTESMVTTRQSDGEYVHARGADEDFEFEGVPSSGFLEIGGETAIYDQVSEADGVFEFHIRNKLDPNIVPVISGTSLTVSTRTLTGPEDYLLSGDGQLSLRELPTRDRMWAPLAQVDEQHVQNTFGRVLDLKSDISTPEYLGRVQGTWAALMTGADYRSVHSGLQLAMGMPVARIAGTVVSTYTVSDSLGQVTRRVMTIRGDGGVVEHDLAPGLWPHIDWSIDPGQTVDRFQPLTNGVAVWDYQTDPNWHTRFPGVSDAERFNSFGVFVALEALSADADSASAMRFAMRIKPTYTKLVMRFLLTSGDEDLSDELDDTLHVVQMPHICEDMTMPEGTAPDDPEQILRLGDGHKLGQGKKLGGTGQWHYQTLGTYVRQGPFDDGQTVKDHDHQQLSASDGSIVSGSQIFTTAGAHVFVDADATKRVTIVGSTSDDGTYEVLERLSSTAAKVNHVFTTTEGSLDWDLMAQGVFMGQGGYSHAETLVSGDGSVVEDGAIFETAGGHVFVSADVGKTLVVQGRGHEILSIVDTTHVVLDTVFEADGSALDWLLRYPIFVSTDVGKNVHVGGLDHKILEVLGDRTVRLWTEFAATEQDLEWELRDYHSLGSGTLGTIAAYRCARPSYNEPSEFVESQQIVTVTMSP